MPKFAVADRCFLCIFRYEGYYNYLFLLIRKFTIAQALSGYTDERIPQLGAVGSVKKLLKMLQ